MVLLELGQVSHLEAARPKAGDGADGPSSTVEPKVAGHVEMDMWKFLESSFDRVFYKLEAHARVLESISQSLDSSERPWKDRGVGPPSRRASTRGSGSLLGSSTVGLMRVGSSIEGSEALGDLIPITPRNSNPGEVRGHGRHFARKSRRLSATKKDETATAIDEFTSYSQADAQMFDAARDQGLKHLETVQEQRKVAEVPRSNSRTIRTFQAMVAHPGFDLFFAALVAANTLFMGIEVELSLASQSEGLASQVLGKMFTVAFTVELLLRVAAHGWKFFWRVQFWNYLDIVVVIAGLVEIIFDVIRAAGSQSGSAPSMLSLRALRILRITRMLKIIRVLRIFRFVLALRTLVQSTIHTLKSLFWALVLLGLIIYVFALVFTEVSADNIRDHRHADEEIPSKSLKYFGSVTTTMLSLFMSISGGVSWEDVLEPLRDISEIWVCLFIVFISFTYFAVLNVMTAVFCESAIDSAQSDHSTKCQAILADKEMHIEKIKDLFSEIDEESTGIITYQTFQRKMNNPEVRTYFETIDLNVWDAWGFFKLLDLDAGGAVEIEEFLLGCLRLRGSARSMDVAKLMYDQAWHIKNQGRFWAFVEERLKQIHEQMAAACVR